MIGKYRWTRFEKVANKDLEFNSPHRGENSAASYIRTPHHQRRYHGSNARLFPWNLV